MKGAPGAGHSHAVAVERQVQGASWALGADVVDGVLDAGGGERGGADATAAAAHQHAPVALAAAELHAVEGHGGQAGVAGQARVALAPAPAVRASAVEGRLQPRAEQPSGAAHANTRRRAGMARMHHAVRVPQQTRLCCNVRLLSSV